MGHGRFRAPDHRQDQCLAASRISFQLGLCGGLGTPSSMLLRVQAHFVALAWCSAAVGSSACTGVVHFIAEPISLTWCWCMPIKALVFVCTLQSFIEVHIWDLLGGSYKPCSTTAYVIEVAQVYKPRLGGLHRIRWLGRGEARRQGELTFYQCL